ncbi:hypothetical protein EMIT0P12_60085 [Pseudomonas sp. IT-P12]
MACIDLFLKSILQLKEVNLPLAAPGLRIRAVESFHDGSCLMVFSMSNRRKENLEEVS